MAITSVQQGLIVEHEFAKLLMMGSGGKVEVARPLSDDERRDYEIHVKGLYGPGLAVQVKSTLALRRHSARTHYLNAFFVVRTGRVVNHPRYWYFIAYLDTNLMRLGEPTFLIPSKEFHERANPSRRGDQWSFSFQANMEPEARDKWYPYRVGTVELGKRALEIMRDLNKQRAVA